MKTIATTLLLFLAAISAFEAHAQTLSVMDFDAFEKYISKPAEGKLRVVNFWATSCRPCIKEMPYFEKLNSEMENVEVIFVSVDFPEDFETKVKAFIQQRKLQSECLALDESNPNAWIDRLNPEWSGAIPATLLVDASGKKADFHAGSFEYGSLVSFVEPYLVK